MSIQNIKMDKLKVFIWKLLYGTYYRFCYLCTYKVRKLLCIFDSETTVRYILNHRCSVSRFGDGEFQMITHYINKGTIDSFLVDSFQNYDAKLAMRLMEVLTTYSPNHLVCIPYAFKKSSVFKGYERIFFEREWLKRKKNILNFLLDRNFGDTNFTRFYYGRQDIKDYNAYIKLLKCLWDKKEVLLVEGEQSRLGVGNDLFDNALNIHRVLCPSVNAFEKYEAILSTVKTFPKDWLIMIALGHTATVLACDLSKYGYQALDIGHIDIEYEWMKMKATRKVAIQGKYVNEVPDDGGRTPVQCKDSVYLSQIVKRIE